MGGTNDLGFITLTSLDEGGHAADDDENDSYKWVISGIITFILTLVLIFLLLYMIGLIRRRRRRRDEEGAWEE